MTIPLDPIDYNTRAKDADELDAGWRRTLLWTVCDLAKRLFLSAAAKLRVSHRRNSAVFWGSAVAQSWFVIRQLTDGFSAVPNPRTAEFEKHKLCATLLFGVDPDALESRARSHGAQIVQPVADKGHGWREVMVADTDGYVWAVGVPLPK